ncbi:MAG: VCBS repeat-containing protein [Planctomycetes bacterium]|nr:VCBS repeat-containing protein [Planctomycetota bacterium]
MSKNVLLILGFIIISMPAYAQFKPLQQGDFTDYGLTFFGKQQDVITCDLNKDGLTDIMVTHYGVKDAKWLRYVSIYYQFEKITFTNLPFQTLVLPDTAVALTWGDFTEEDGMEIAFYAEDGVYYFGSENGLYSDTPKLLLYAPTFFKKPQRISIPIFMGNVDIDGNGRDDLVIPQKNNVKILLQTQSGLYEKICDLQCLSSNTVARGADMRKNMLFQYETAMPVISCADMNGDRRKDIILLTRKHYDCFLQNKESGFSSKPDFSAELPVTNDEKITGNRLDTAFVKFVDINNDSCVDLLITSTEGELASLDTLNTKQYLFINNKNGTYPAVPNQIIRVDGVSIFPQITDIDHDGSMDMALSSFNIDIGSTARVALLGDVAITYYVYHFLSGKNRFGDIPDFDRTVYVPNKKLEKGGGKFMTNMHFTGDFNGDGKNDMLIYSATQKDNMEIRINSENKSNIRFEKDSYFIDTIKDEDLPKEIRVLDFNKDGKSDILMLYGGSRMTVKIAKKIK